jgi:hypothetical protein
MMYVSPGRIRKVLPFSANTRQSFVAREPQSDDHEQHDDAMRALIRELLSKQTPANTINPESSSTPQIGGLIRGLVRLAAIRET